MIRKFKPVHERITETNEPYAHEAHSPPAQAPVYQGGQDHFEALAIVGIGETAFSAHDMKTCGRHERTIAPKRVALSETFAIAVGRVGFGDQASASDSAARRRQREKNPRRRDHIAMHHAPHLSFQAPAWPHVQGHIGQRLAPP